MAYIIEITKKNIKYLLENKIYEKEIPLQEGKLFWKKNYYLNFLDPLYNNLSSELKEKGYIIIIQNLSAICNNKIQNCTYIKISNLGKGRFSIYIINYF